MGKYDKLLNYLSEKYKDLDNLIFNSDSCGDDLFRIGILKGYASAMMDAKCFARREENSLYSWEKNEEAN